MKRLNEALIKIMNIYIYLYICLRADGVEYLPNIHKALGLIPDTTMNKQTTPSNKRDPTNLQREKVY